MAAYKSTDSYYALVTLHCAVKAVKQILHNTVGFPNDKLTW